MWGKTKNTPSGEESLGPNPKSVTQSLWAFCKSRIGRVVLVVLVVMLATWLIPRLAQSTQRSTVAYDALNEIVVENNGGNVRVEGPAGGQSSLEVTKTFLMRAPTVSLTQEGSRARVKSSCASVNIGICRADIVVRAPAGVNVKVTTQRGQIRTNGTLANLDLSAQSGNVILERSVGSIRAQTRSGTISGSAIGAGDLFARTQNGAITLPFSDTPRSVDAESNSGNIAVTVPKSPNPYRADVTTATGKITLDIVKDPNAPWSLRIVSQSGDVTVKSS